MSRKKRKRTRKKRWIRKRKRLTIGKIQGRRKENLMIVKILRK